MDWTEVSITVPIPWAEAAIALFEGLGAGSAVDEHHGRARIRAWFVPATGPSPEQLDSWCESLVPLVGEMPDWSFTTVRDEDWRDGYKQHFQPFAVGQRLWISPSWQQGDPPVGRTMVRIDPGLAFGTGQHATTRQMLELLEQAIGVGDRVLDVGTGSGILALAAVALGAGAVVAVDNDPGAVAAARENCQGGAPAIRISQGDATVLSVSDGDRFHVVVSNLVADPVIELASRCAGWLRDTGTWLIGGVISAREDDVTAALSRWGWKIQDRLVEDEWVALRVTPCSG